ncbi:uncharacterized protein LOC128042530 [Gossypium raimondii]|uniref:uncharacterized protein LOC128042530 n=1 Tax=Gossypium raimondii TaxID=29730 RepID=UPI00227AB597|nr:uncharacterized protein LOC128042530 [Gossypium raimondii]
MAYELEPHIFRQRMIRLESDMEGQTNTSFPQWLGTMEPWQWAQSFDEDFRYGQMTTNLVEGINAVLLKTRHLPQHLFFFFLFFSIQLDRARVYNMSSPANQYGTIGAANQYGTIGAANQKPSTRVLSHRRSFFSKTD